MHIYRKNIINKKQGKVCENEPDYQQGRAVIKINT